MANIGFAQQDDVKQAFLEKWENSKNYLLAIAEAMPEEDFDFKPTERQMSFKEQLLHIEDNMLWLKDSYILNTPVKREKTKATTISKEAIVESLTNSFGLVYNAVLQMPDSQLNDIVEFFAGPKSKLQILNLLQDHLTHHRGQLIVYLNLNKVEPPKYSGW